MAGVPVNDDPNDQMQTKTVTNTRPASRPMRTTRAQSIDFDTLLHLSTPLRGDDLSNAEQQVLGEYVEQLRERLPSDDVDLMQEAATANTHGWGFGSPIDGTYHLAPGVLSNEGQIAAAERGDLAALRASGCVSWGRRLTTAQLDAACEELIARHKITSPDGWPIVSMYTRAQAIADGELIDVSDSTEAAGYSVPVAITRAVNELVSQIPDRHPEQQRSARLRDVLLMAGLAAQRSRLQHGTEAFEVTVLTDASPSASSKEHVHTLYIAVSAEGVGGAPVATVMTSRDL